MKRLIARFLPLVGYRLDQDRPLSGQKCVIRIETEDGHRVKSIINASELDAAITTSSVERLIGKKAEGLTMVLRQHKDSKVFAR